MSANTSLGARLVAWCVGTEGSTRSCALIRIGLVLLIWARWAHDFVLLRDPELRVAAFSVCFFVATTAMLFGIFARASTLATASLVLFLYYYVGVHLGRGGYVHHHTYLLAFATFLCALTPCGRSYSFDRWWAVRRARSEGHPAPPERGNLWGLRLIALQLSIVYLFSAYDKSTLEFLSGARLERIFLWYYTGSDTPARAGFHAAMVSFSWASVALEYALAVGLLFARSRRWLVIPGLAFHGIIYLTLPVATFTLTMWLLYLAYFDADTVHRVIEHLEGRPASSATA